jgi:hypothetical protein
MASLWTELEPLAERLGGDVQVALASQPLLFTKRAPHSHNCSCSLPVRHAVSPQERVKKLTCMNAESRQEGALKEEDTSRSCANRKIVEKES